MLKARSLLLRRKSGGSSGLAKRTRRPGFGKHDEWPKEEYLLCPNCGEQISHNRDVPCFTSKCPVCGAKLIRE